MTDQIDKAELLAQMQAGYTTCEALLARLNETQMTTPGVNGAWSVKDHLAHLAAWHLRQLALLQGVRQGREPEIRLVPDSSVDELNEQVFQDNKHRPLAEVLAAFRSSYQRVEAEVQAMTKEELNEPIAWLNHRPIWLWVAGNTYEHYEEHGGFIRNWLASQEDRTGTRPSFVRPSPVLATRDIRSEMSSHPFLIFALHSSDR